MNLNDKLTDLALAIAKVCNCKVGTEGGAIQGNLTIGGILNTASQITMSDKNKKENLEVIEEDLLKGIKPYRYNFKGTTDRRIGLVAQDMTESIPEAVFLVNSNTDKYLAVDYNAIVALLVGKVNRLEKEIEELKARL
jgi:hypothetical protein